jgi:two-component system sensor histidine kinase VicK
LWSADLRQALIDAKNRGVNTRYIVEITNDNIQYCKELTKIVSKLRHLNGAIGNFAVSDTKYLGSGGAFLRESELSQLVYSNVATIVRQNQYMFSTLWNNARSAEVRIRELEEGIEPVKVEVIHDPAFARDVFRQLAVSASKEIMLIYPTVRAFMRHEKLGTTQLLTDATKRGARIRILMVKDKSSEMAVRDVQQQNDSVAVRFIKKEERSINKTTSLMVDDKSLLVIELKDDSKDDFVGATGLTTYSNSGPGVLAFISLFEDLWMQSNLFEQVLEANRRLAEQTNS